MSPTEFGEYLALQRKRKGYTQKQLAELLFVTDKAISRWECGLGFPDIRMLQPISQALGVSLVELLNAQPLEEPLASTPAANGAVQSALTISQSEIVSVRFKVWRNILVFFLFTAILLNLYVTQGVGILLILDRLTCEYPYQILYWARHWIANIALMLFGLSCYFPKKRFLIPLSLWSCVLSTACSVAALIFWRILESNGVIDSYDSLAFFLFPAATILQVIAAIRYQKSNSLLIRILLLLSSVCVFLPVFLSMVTSGYWTVLHCIVQSVSLISPMLLLAVFLRIPSVRHFGQVEYP